MKLLFAPVLPSLNRYATCYQAIVWSKGLVRIIMVTLFLSGPIYLAFSQDTTEITVRIIQGESKTESIGLGTCIVFGNTVHSKIDVQSDPNFDIINKGISAHGIPPNIALVDVEFDIIAGRTAPIGEYIGKISYRISDSPIIDNDSRTCIFTIILVKVIIEASPKAVIADFKADRTKGGLPLTVQFQDKSLGNITSWQWLFGDGNSSLEKNPNYSYSETGTYDVTLIVKGPEGTDTLTLPKYIQANQILSDLPGKWIMISGTDDGVPIGDFDVTLEFTLDSLKSFWKDGKIEPTAAYEISDGKIIADYGGTITLPGFIPFDQFDFFGVAIGFGEIQVTVQNDTLKFSGVSNFLASSDDLIEITFVREITECQLSVNLVTSDVACFGDSTGSARIEVQNGQEGIKFQWSSGASSENANDLIAGNYSVTVSDDTGCEVVDSFTVNQPSEIALVIDSIGHDNGSANGYIAITISGGTAPYSTEWSNADGSILFDEDIQSLRSGLYSLTITDLNMCMIKLDSIFVDLTTAVHEKIENPISVYPNPTTGIIYLRNPSDEKLDTHVTVFDLLGRRVLETKWKENKIHLIGLDHGYYIIKFHVDNEVHLMKILHN